ncbi:hypothetical protein FOXG_22413 [Fusarium oxysporum f. sp. lycopersici 4287]|uniref:C2H2-type domain-containing protein n=1 Tax=Fusarium oxysporum f. sp. lycopersici (strain 4287 / CBS 123668 / FGSC 9935 / NRRL 34936) TaxID=426428 RepID=A0A0J9W6Y7_FUSO4|nr:hypothetical protein FOXG_19464 [Fusarium oxysporum f. sp. lycopersici 4287]XP_018256624.1 hypothetical protein FOXG_22293 [Fusarium oxysporum f. sp. lycopersici 4287]XP_018256625.1 hypothetical protein FOXG_22293 [Fusarium oxysporum f. sp. lycopersici 4287]XP_018256626.1 hypothetical protein FOXG_22293 [Fusarium oxysporum f. sp. lycopersici 4287]XP_018256934.1 hypothetical protein FOXG_22413 [Fusarium oxysporum f. sp. lycopersici 4287]KAJ9412375.1 hypothetical protein QL093DRAFT_2552377 [F
MDSPSPELKPICPKLNLSRSPSPDIPRDQIGPNGTSQATGGVGMLLRHLGNGWNPPEISLEAARESLLRDEDSLSEEPRREGAVDGNLASGALLIKDPFVSRYISGNTVTSPRIPSSNESLSPLYHGVRAPAGEPPSQSLPSFRSTFGELHDLPPERLSEQDLGRARPGPSSTFPNSRAGSLGHKTTNLPSSPHSPPDGYRASLPCSTAGMSWHHCPVNGNHPRAPTAYSSSNSGESPNTDHTNSTPAISTRVNSTSVADRMSIDGIAGSYTCTVHGCNAAPFQTQYLLNSHMNVHSSIRPHYCPVKGCPRSEGGKGFKRKNEMIRHGLVHDSPGYVCPFCPDREHKYPRPDNLQRHVRVHHIDKDKDDPQLRDVLAQRPDGPNRDRRSRNPPS